MSKRKNSRPPTTMNAGRKVSSTDKTVGTYKEKKIGTIIGTQLLAGTEVRIVEFQGGLYVPEVDVAAGLDQERNNFRHLLERNLEILENYPLEVTVTSGVAPRPLRLLSIENVRRSIMLVDHNVKDPDRKAFLIERKRHYFKIIDDVCSGNSKKDALLSSEDLDRIGTTYKSRAGMNGLRMRIRRTRFKVHHPGRNLSVRDDIRLYEEDYLYVKGPGKLEPGWRKKCNDKEGRTLQAKQFFDMHEFMLDNLDDDTRRKNVLNHFQQYAPELITEHMPIRLETTTQTKLLTEGAV